MRAAGEEGASTVDWATLLDRTSAIAQRFLAGSADRAVGSSASMGQLVEALGGALPSTGRDPVEVIEMLARCVDPGLVLTNGGRYFGFVEGGVLSAALPPSG